MISMGKFRHLSQCATDDGHFVILAIDHRPNLLAELNRYVARPLFDSEFADFKQEIIRRLSPESTGLLTDPAYGLSMGIPDRTIPGRIGLLAPLEVTNYNVDFSQRSVNFIPYWSVEKIKRIGGSGVKLLLYFHPEAPDANEKLAVVKQIIFDCEQYEIPFFLEPITYSLVPERYLDNVELLQI